MRDYTTAGPYRWLKNFQPLEWNTIEVRVDGNFAVCYCNDEVIERDIFVPDSGPIGIEGDRGQVEYRNIAIRLEEHHDSLLTPFDVPGSWKLEVASGCEGTMEIADRTLTVRTNKTDGVNWHVQAVQPNLTFENGALYELNVSSSIAN